MPSLVGSEMCIRDRSVRESDRRCPLLSFCPKRISVGRAHHHRKRMHSIRRLRTKLPFRSNILLCCISFELSCCYYSLRRWGGGSTGVIREPRHWPLLLVSCRTARIREFPPPQPTGRGTNTHTQSLATETPNGSKPLTTPNSQVASILRCSAPYSTLAWLPLPYFLSLC